MLPPRGLKGGTSPPLVFSLTRQCHARMFHLCTVSGHGYVWRCDRHAKRMRNYVQTYCRTSPHFLPPTGELGAWRSGARPMGDLLGTAKWRAAFLQNCYTTVAVYSQDSTNSLRCLCQVTMNEILQEHSPPFSFGVDELSILKRWTLPRRWCLNPAYHREAITSGERSFFSKEPSRFRHDELCETRRRSLIPLACSYRSPLCYSEWSE